MDHCFFTSYLTDSEDYFQYFIASEELVFIYQANKMALAAIGTQMGYLIGNPFGHRLRQHSFNNDDINNIWSKDIP